MNPAHLTVVLVAIGLVANGTWTVVNLRIENAISAKIEKLKSYIEETYPQKPICEVRHAEIEKFFAHLEERYTDIDHRLRALEAAR